MQDILHQCPLTAGGVDDVPLRGCDAPQDKGQPVCYAIALRIPGLRVVNHIHRGCPLVPLAHLFGVSGTRHDDIKISGLEPLLDIPAMHLGGRKSGVERKAHAVIDAVEINLCHIKPTP